jgi:hypothetical protein
LLSHSSHEIFFIIEKFNYDNFEKNVAILVNEPATSMYISGRWRILCHHNRNRTTATMRMTAPPMLPIITLSVEFLDPPVAITKHLV